MLAGLFELDGACLDHSAEVGSEAEALEAHEAGDRTRRTQPGHEPVDRHTVDYGEQFEVTLLLADDSRREMPSEWRSWIQPQWRWWRRRGPSLPRLPGCVPWSRFLLRWIRLHRLRCKSTKRLVNKLRGAHATVSTHPGPRRSRIAGSGPPLALVHGGTGTAAFNWDVVLEPLSQTNTMVAMDMRAHGYSPIGDGQWHGALGLDVAGMMSRIGCPSFALIGFSMGANASIRIAHPALAGHVPGHSGCVRRELSRDRRRDPHRSVARELRGLPHPAATPAANIGSGFEKSSPPIGRTTSPSKVDFLQRVAAPVLAIHGADVITDPDRPRRLAAGVPNGRAIFVPRPATPSNGIDPAAFLEAVGGVSATDVRSEE